MEPTQLPNYLAHVSYAGIFATLAFLDAFVPLPEEIVLLGIGDSAAFEALNEVVVGAIALAALLIGDNVSFWLARTGGRWLDRLTRRSGKAFLGVYGKRMRAHTGKTLLAMTFIPSVRFFAPIVAGTVQTPWCRFILFDTLSVLAYVGVYLTLGYHFHRPLDRFTQVFDSYRHFAVYGLLALLGVGFAVRQCRRRSRRAVEK